MKEYWVNVYDGIFGARHPNRKDSDITLKIFGADYRIHVKMDGGYNKRKDWRQANRPVPPGIKFKYDDGNGY